MKPDPVWAFGSELLTVNDCQLLVDKRELDERTDGDIHDFAAQGAEVRT